MTALTQASINLVKQQFFSEENYLSASFIAERDLIRFLTIFRDVGAGNMTINQILNETDPKSSVAA